MKNALFDSVFNFDYFIAKQGVSSFQIEVIVVRFRHFDRSMQKKVGNTDKRAPSTNIKIYNMLL